MVGYRGRSELGCFLKRAFVPCFGCRHSRPSDATHGCAHYLRWRAAGKLSKIALVAAMRKLLHAIFSVAKNRKPFVSAVTQVTP